MTKEHPAHVAGALFDQFVPRARQATHKWKKARSAAIIACANRPGAFLLDSTPRGDAPAGLTGCRGAALGQTWLLQLTADLNYHYYPDLNYMPIWQAPPYPGHGNVALVHWRSGVLPAPAPA